MYTSSMYTDMYIIIYMYNNMCLSVMVSVLERLYMTGLHTGFFSGGGGGGGGGLLKVYVTLCIINT